MFHLHQHAPVFGGGLRRFGDNAQEIQRAASALAFGVQRLQVVDQRPAGTAVVGQFLFQVLPLAGEVSGNRQARLDRREELRLLLDHLGEALFHQAVQNFVDFLPRHVRPRRQFQRFEFRVAQQHEVRPRLVSIEPKLLQASPKALKINFGQFFAHIHLTLSKPGSLSLTCQSNPNPTALGYNVFNGFSTHLRLSSQLVGSVFRIHTPAARQVDRLTWYH